MHVKSSRIVYSNLLLNKFIVNVFLLLFLIIIEFNVNSLKFIILTCFL